MSHRVECINKTNRPSAHECIHGIGGRNANGSRWWLSQQEAIGGIELGRYAFHVERPSGHRVKVVVARTAWGNKYLKTEADGEQPNNLLALAECRL